MSGVKGTGWSLLENLPEVPLRKVVKMLGKDDKKSLRLVSHRWMMTVWQHDKKCRVWMVNEKDIDEYKLSTHLLHPNYTEQKPDIVVWIQDSFEGIEDKLKPLKDNIVGFKLYDVNVCKDLMRAGYQTLERLSIDNVVDDHQVFLPRSQHMLQLIKNSCSTLISLDLAKVDLSIFTNLQENFSTLSNLKVSSCVNEEGLAALLKCCRVSLKSLKFHNFEKLNLSVIAEQLEPFGRLSELEIMYGNRVPAEFIDLSFSSLKTLKIGHIQTNLNSLLSLKNKLVDLTTLLVDHCIVGEDLKFLMKLAPAITEFRLYGCKKESMWKTSGSYLKNVKYLTLNASSNEELMTGQITSPIANYTIPDVVNLVYQQSHKHLTCLKLEGVDFSLLKPQPGDLPCLRDLKITFPQQESKTIALLFACRSSLEVLELNADGLFYGCEDYKGVFPKLRKVTLKNICVGIWYHVSDIMNSAPTLEDVTLIVEEIEELNFVAPNHWKIKKLKINVQERSTVEGYDCLWMFLVKVSTTLESLFIIMTSMIHMNTKIKINKSLKMPNLTFLFLFGFDDAAPALLKTCSESLVHLKVWGLRSDSSWVNRLRCNLPKLRRAYITPAPQPDHMEYFKKRCYSTTVIKTTFSSGLDCEF